MREIHSGLTWSIKLPYLEFIHCFIALGITLRCGFGTRQDRAVQRSNTSVSEGGLRAGSWRAHLCKHRSSGDEHGSRLRAPDGPDAEERSRDVLDHEVACRRDDAHAVLLWHCKYGLVVEREPQIVACIVEDRGCAKVSNKTAALRNVSTVSSPDRLASLPKGSTR
jgi:hypothetical protein